MGFWVTLGWYLFFTALSFVLRPRPRRNAPQPSSRGDIEAPTADEGRAIPYVAGTGLVEGPNVLWSGDYEAQEIIESSQVVGFKYFMGLQYGICLGTIDRLLDVRFDQKILTLAAFGVTPSLVLSVKVGATSYNVPVPSGEFASGPDFARAMTDAMRAATPDQDVRVVWGYEVPEGATLGVQVGSNLYTARPRPGVYTGAEMAEAVHFGILSAGATEVFPSYDTGDGKFTFKKLTGGDVDLLAEGSTLLSTLGFSDVDDVTLPAPPAGIEGLETGPDRFFFMLPAGTEIEWSAPATDCHAVFGMELAAADFTSSSVCDNPVASATPLATYGEFDAGARITFSAPNLFGGIKAEGGIEGVIDVYYGGDAQFPDPYLETQWGASAPPYRGLCYAVARKLYQGTAPYLKKISFVVERCPNSLGLTDDKHRIFIGGGALGDDANPACVLYDILTDDRWGLGIDPGMIDVDSFRAAGETLWSEGLGVSIIVEEAVEAQDLIDDVRRHIDGVMYPDPESNLLVLKLVRADYDVETLPVLDETLVRSVKLSRTAWEETRNVIRIQYVDRTQNHTPRVLQIQNLANVQMLGRTAVEDIPFRAVSNPQAAEIVGDRALRTLSYPMGRLELEVNRAAWKMLPAGVFRLNWPALGLTGFVCRVSRARPGEIRDNTIDIEAVEDIYALDQATFIPFS